MDHPVDSTEDIAQHIRATSDMKRRIELAGLLRRPYREGETKQECSNCIYFLPNHAFCDYPDFKFPVDADWWCRLWRV